MKLLHHGIYLVLAAILQVTLIDGLSVFGAAPNLFLIIVVIIGFMCGRIQGMFTGIVFGFVFDILVGRFLGLNMLCFMIIGYLSAMASDRFYVAPSLYVFMLYTAAATALSGLFYAVPCIAVYHSGILSLVKITLIECVYNSIVALPLTLILKRTLPLVHAGKY